MVKVNDKIYILENQKGGAFCLKDGTRKCFESYHAAPGCHVINPNENKEIYDKRIKSLEYYMKITCFFEPNKIIVAYKSHLIVPVDPKNKLVGSDLCYNYVRLVKLTPEEFEMIDDQVL